MKTEILSKIQSILKKETQGLDEYQVIFLLTKIRKYLELENLKNKYVFLKLYCDWALHPQINDTKLLEEHEIFKSRNLSEQEVLFMEHRHFFKELNTFSGQIFGETYITRSDQVDAFRDILDEILKNTPLIFEKEKTKTTLNKDDKNRFWHTSANE